MWVNVKTRTAKGTSNGFFEIVLTTGSHHYQVYWYDTSNPRVLAHLPYVYLIDEQKWIPRTSVFLLPPTDVGESVVHAEQGRWNTTCIRCHATGGVPKPIQVDGTERLDTRVTEF